MDNVQINENKDTLVRFWPIFIGSTLTALLECVGVFLDETVTGQLFDDSVFGAINVIEPYVSVINFISYLICVGGGALIVRAHGSGNKQKMTDIFSHCLTCCLGVCVLFFIIFSVFERPLISFVTDGGSMYEHALAAFFWKKFHIIPIVFYAFLFTYVLYMGGAVFCSVASVLELLSNLVLSVILGKHMGVGGITLASFLASCLSLSVLLLFFIPNDRHIPVKLRFERRLAYDILLLGFGESSIFIAEALIEGGLNYISLHRYGLAGVVVISVVINLFEIAAYVTEGISEYETVAVNEFIGSNRSDKLDRSMKITLLSAVAEGFVFCLIFYIAAPYIPVLFGIDSEEYATLSASCIRILAFCPVFIALDRIIAVFYQYTGHINRTVILFLFSWGILPVLYGWGFSFISIQGMSFALILSALTVPICMIVYYSVIKHEKPLQTIRQ